MFQCVYFQFHSATYPVGFRRLPLGGKTGRKAYSKIPGALPPAVSVKI
jgi:hypothetical protein